MKRRKTFNKYADFSYKKEEASKGTKLSEAAMKALCFAAMTTAITDGGYNPSKVEDCSFHNEGGKA